MKAERIKFTVTLVGMLSDETQELTGLGYGNFVVTPTIPNTMYDDMAGEKYQITWIVGQTLRVFGGFTLRRHALEYALKLHEAIGDRPLKPSTTRTRRKIVALFQEAKDKYGATK